MTADDAPGRDHDGALAAIGAAGKAAGTSFGGVTGALTGWLGGLGLAPADLLTEARVREIVREELAALGDEL